jgi:hypothetical protein
VALQPASTANGRTEVTQPEAGSKPASLSARLYLLLALGLLAAFLVSTIHLRTDSFWNDEAWTAWAVRSPYLADTLARVRADVHPPLYFLILYGWVGVAGESVYAIRLLSVLFGMIGLAATYAVARRLFDARTGVYAALLLGASSFFVYYTREARMYTLLLALASLSTWAYLAWRDGPTLRRTLLYALSMAALLYTHYAGALIAITHLIHLLLVRPRAWKRANWLRFPLPYGLAALLYLPWLPIFLSQMKANPNGPLAIPVKTDWAAVAALVLILTGGSWALMAAPLALAIPRLRRDGAKILLLLLWLLLTPAALLALNAWAAPVYQVRYSIAMLPAGALILAWGLRNITLPRRLTLRNGRMIPLQMLASVALLAWILYIQLTIYPDLWPGKPPWGPTIAAMVDVRKPLEPTITDIADYSPTAYYDRQLHLRQGISLDLSWRLHTAEEAFQIANLFRNEPSVWVALPVNTAKSWHIISTLAAERQVGYRDSLVNMVFYRFDKGTPGSLRFRFGDVLRYQRGPDANRLIRLRAGETLCTNLNFTALGDTSAYSAGLHLVDITGNRIPAAWDGGIGIATSGDSVTLSPCVAVPPDTPPGPYHLELVVYDWTTLGRLLVIEDGAGGGLSWGDVLMLEAVDLLPR